MKPRRYSALIKEAAIKCEMKYPMPPPRPTKTLPKKYQPLPPEPEESIIVPPLRKSMSQSNTFPMTGKNIRQPWIKELEALGPSRVPELKDKQVLSLKSMKYALNSVPDHSIQSKLKCFPERPASRESHSASQQKTEHIYVNLKNQLFVKPTEKDLYSCNWYIKEFDRQEAEEALLQENCDGVFLVRDCSKKSIEEPYVLVIFYRSRVYNIKVRFLEESQQYALGSGLRGNDKFDSVEEIIEYYKQVPITLIDGNDASGTMKEQCYLTQPLQMRRFNLT